MKGNGYMIKVIRSRAETMHVEGLIAENVTSLFAIAEMEIEEDGETKFLTAEWVDALDKRIVFEVTDVCIYDMITYRDGSPEELEEIRENAKVLPEFITDGHYKGNYPEQYEALTWLIKDRLVRYEKYDPLRGRTEEEAARLGIGWGF